MTVLTVGSEEARLKMRDLLDTVFLGGRVIINRNRRPSAVMISHERWQKIDIDLKRLKRLEVAKLARERYAERDKPGAFLNEEEYQAALKAAGLDE